MYYVYVLCICKNKNNNPRVLGARGGLERSNPAKETTHSGTGEKETHYMNVVGKKSNNKSIRTEGHDLYVSKTGVGKSSG